MKQTPENDSCFSRRPNPQRPRVSQDRDPPATILQRQSSGETSIVFYSGKTPHLKKTHCSSATRSNKLMFTKRKRESAADRLKLTLCASQSIHGSVSPRLRSSVFVVILKVAFPHQQHNRVVTLPSPDSTPRFIPPPIPPPSSSAVPSPLVKTTVTGSPDKLQLVSSCSAHTNAKPPSDRLRQHQQQIL